MENKLIELLHDAVERDASDIFIVAGCPVAFKIKGDIIKTGESLLPADTKTLIDEIYSLTNETVQENRIKGKGEDDFSFSIPQIGRFRVNVYYQRGSLSAVLRIVRFTLPNPAELNIPDTVINFANQKKGLVLVTGSAGSGKSTTLACIIDKINQTRNTHIITIEDPIEYLHRHQKSIVSQREIAHDTEDYASALRASLREAPDVILVGEMRDLETIQVALSAAETGHLVFSTLHTIGAAETINRIIDVFPPSQQHQIKIQLSMVLQAVVSQQLIPTLDGKMAPAFEIMVSNNAIKTQIRDGKVHQIDNYILSGKSEGMISMDESVYNLYQQNIISKEDAILYATNSEIMSRKVK